MTTLNVTCMCGGFRLFYEESFLKSWGFEVFKCESKSSQLGVVKCESKSSQLGVVKCESKSSQLGVVKCESKSSQLKNQRLKLLQSVCIEFI